MKYEEYIYTLDELRGKAPKLFGIPTGTKLDEMFYTVTYDEKEGKYVKKPLGGIPYISIINVTGIPDTRKSVLAEQEFRVGVVVSEDKRAYEKFKNGELDYLLGVASPYGSLIRV